jgi:uncharacterized protein
MTLDELRRSKRDEILRIAPTYGASNVRVFGSLSRGGNSSSSDVDILVDLDPNRSLMDLGGLLMDLIDVLHLPVDVATEDMLRPKLRERALLDAVPL